MPSLIAFLFLGGFEFIAAQGALSARQKDGLTESLSGNTVQPGSLFSTAAYFSPVFTADATARTVAKTVTATGDVRDSRWPFHRTSSLRQTALTSTPNSMTTAKPSAQPKSSYPTVKSSNNGSLATPVSGLGGSTFAGPITFVDLRSSEDDRSKISTVSEYHSLPVIEDPGTSKTTAQTTPFLRTSALDASLGDSRTQEPKLLGSNTPLSTSTPLEMQGHTSPNPTTENESLPGSPLGTLANTASNSVSSSSISSENQAFLGGFLGDSGHLNVDSNTASTPSIGNGSFRGTTSSSDTTKTAGGTTVLPTYSSPEHSLDGSNPSLPLITTNNNLPSLTDSSSALPGGFIRESSGTPILTTQSSTTLLNVNNVSSDTFSGVSSASVSSTRLNVISDSTRVDLLDDLSTVSTGFPSLTSTIIISTPSLSRPLSSPVFAFGGSSDATVGSSSMKISPSVPAAISELSGVTSLASITTLSVDAGKLSSAWTTQTSQITRTQKPSTIEITTLTTTATKPTRSDSDSDSDFWAPSSVHVKPPTSGGGNDGSNTKSGGTNSNSSGDGGASSSSHPQASSVGIGVGTVAGAIAYGAGMFWITRRYRRRQRLNSNVNQGEQPSP